jgi:hypothetical protein
MRRCLPERWEIQLRFVKKNFIRQEAMGPSRCPCFVNSGLCRFFRRRPKFARAVLARADCPQIVEAVNSSRVPVVEVDLHSVVADSMRGLGAEFGLEHGEQRGIQRRSRCLHGIFLFQLLIFPLPIRLFLSLIIAHRARTLFPEIREVVMAGVAVGPRDVNAGARGHVHLYTRGFSSFIDGYWHRMAILPGD